MQTIQNSEDLMANTMRANFDIFIENGWNKKDMPMFRAISAENYIRNLNGIEVANNQSEMEANMNIYFTGFPDSRLSVDNITIKDLHLFTHWTFSGTNTGVFGETGPTGKKIKVSGFSTIEFNGKGKIIRESVYYNELELLQQLGFTLNPPVVE